MIKGTIDKDISVNYEDSNLNISESATLDNKIRDLSSRLDVINDKYTDLQQESYLKYLKINDLTTEMNKEKEKNEKDIKDLTNRVKTIEKIFIVCFSLLMLNSIYIITNLGK